MNINEKLQAALKSMTVDSLGDSVLVPQQSDAFIKVVEAADPILGNARRITMSSHTRNIDRIGYGARVLQKGVEGVAVKNDPALAPITATNVLVAKELVALQPITDSALEDGIEKGGLETTIVELLGNQAGDDLAHLFINGDTASTDEFLSVTDGWLKKAGNVVDETDFDATDIEDVFEKMILAMPAKHFKNRNKFRFYVTLKAENDYRNALRARGTVLGDAAQTSADGISYKGIAVEVCNNMPEGKVMLVGIDNLVYGIYRDVKIENERNAKARAYDFVLSLRADCHFENEDAVVVAKGYTGK